MNKLSRSDVLVEEESKQHQHGLIGVEKLRLIVH
jgi:hypothetical protein